jgi:hypothetical protein
LIGLAAAAVLKAHWATVASFCPDASIFIALTNLKTEATAAPASIAAL